MLNKIKDAYQVQWGKETKQLEPKFLDKLKRDLPDVKVLEFPPSRLHPYWIYASLGMSTVTAGEHTAPEVHIYSLEQSELSVEAISSLIEYVQEGDLFFGDVFECYSEKDHNKCSYLLASFPESDGMGFKETYTADDKEILFILLLPITYNEKIYLEKHGLDALDEKFHEKEIMEFNWDRKSIV